MAVTVNWDGTLSCTQFYTAASSFSDLWTKFNNSFPNWSWIPSAKRPWIPHNHEEGYLAVENVILPRLSQVDHGEVDRTEEQDYSCAGEDELIDTATLIQSNGGEHYYNFHIVYSASYKVPVLYFRAYYRDGQPLALEDFEKSIPIDSAQLISRSKWTFITLEDHPELKRPWYTLHPCGTNEWMKLFFLKDSDVAQGRVPVEKYLVSWFSVVGQLFGLKIPFQMLLNTNLSLHGERQ